MLAIPSGGVAAGVPFYETWELSFNFNTVNLGVEVNVPSASSIDFNSADAVGTPEPATLGLIGSALALLGFARRRKR